ncbi:hypothetical protein [Streptomyces flaveus]|uniref:Uncharacterized protein n=1 Tax=Streptomyces flaveus TaxID=66370 RepID=A0A917VJE1_9ACTN|nr:hypothetical protein [Streptomyces flaveus]GGK90789.1 hypothetical protein GCM10010094_59730 [Streptomyces flaveus]
MRAVRRRAGAAEAVASAPRLIVGVDARSADSGSDADTAHARSPNRPERRPMHRARRRAQTADFHFLITMVR